MTGPGRRRLEEAPGKPGASEGAETREWGRESFLEIQGGAEAPRGQAGQRAGRTWPSGVRPLLGLQVPVAPLAPDERSQEQPVEGTRTGARRTCSEPRDLSVRGTRAASVCVCGGRGTALLGVP